MLLIKGTPLKGHVNIIASKSLSHRYLISAALSNGTSTLHNLMDSDDIKATITALKTLGASIDLPYVKGPLHLNQSAHINAKASGSTLRFLIPVALVQSEKVCFEGEHRLPHRPLDVYERLFDQTNITFKTPKDAWLPLSVKGPLQGGHFKIRGDVSSQFITGLLLATPILKQDSTITIEGPFESKSYVDLTVDTLKDFGVNVATHNKGYTVKGSQTYKPVNKTIEGDYSQAAFFIVAGLFNTEAILIRGLSQTTSQGDAKIIDIVKSMAGDVSFNEAGLIVKPSQTKGTEIDLQNIPDLGPILMVLAAFSSGKTIFKNIERLRIKESDRVASMSEMLNKLKIHHTIDDHTMVIEGKRQYEGSITVNPYDDHRIAMSAIIASLKTKGTITLLDEKCMNKSYPNFVETVKHLGLTIQKGASS